MNTQPPASVSAGADAEEMLALADAIDKCSLDEGAFIEARYTKTLSFALRRAATPSDEVREATAFFQLIEDECWTLRCQSYPGADDAEVGWEVIEHHMAKPYERVVASAPTPLRAIREAALARALSTTGEKKL